MILNNIYNIVKWILSIRLIVLSVCLILLSVRLIRIKRSLKKHKRSFNKIKRSLNITIKRSFNYQSRYVIIVLIATAFSGILCVKSVTSGIFLFYNGRIFEKAPLDEMPYFQGFAGLLVVLVVLVV